MVAAIQQSPNLTRLFEANTVRIFEGVDRTLLLREAYERDPAHFDLPDWSRRTAPVGDFTPILRLIGPDGYTIEPTDFPGGRPLESTYVGDRDHFRAQVDANRRAFHRQAGDRTSHRAVDNPDFAPGLERAAILIAGTDHRYLSTGAIANL
jgi:hypothetical protein